MTDKELLKQALNALEEIHPANVKPMAWEAGNKAITALRSRLAQGEDATEKNFGHLAEEPVAIKALEETVASSNKPWVIKKG